MGGAVGILDFARRFYPASSTNNGRRFRLNDTNASRLGLSALVIASPKPSITKKLLYYLPRLVLL